MAARWLLVAAAAGGCAAAGHGRLAGPALGHPSEWGQWWSRGGPVLATFAVARLLVLAGACYLVALAAIVTVARAVRAEWLLGAIAWMAPPASRRLAMAMAGVVGTAALVVGPPAGVSAAAGLPAGSAAMPGPKPAAGVPLLREVTNPSPLLERVHTAPPPAPPTVPPTAPPTVPSAPSPRIWIVRPGDSLWSIAEATVCAHHQAGDRAVVRRYWLKVIEVNRPHLPVPGNPDLLFPGDRIDLPPL